MGAKSSTVVRRYLVSGRVQGVGYRYFTQRAAVELGLSGWVRNLGDGRVEAHAEGSVAALHEFEGRLRLGPRMAEVRGVEIIPAVAALQADQSDEKAGGSGRRDARIEGFHIR